MQELALKVPDFHDCYTWLSQYMESRYGIKVKICDVVDPNVGDFNGTEILIDYVVNDELGLFVLVHLFGHSVQWNISEELRKFGQEMPGKTDAELERVFAYERDASQYGLKLMHEANITDMDQWLSDWFEADWKFLRHFYKTGEKLDSKELYKPGAGELLLPLEIPKFTPEKFSSRYAF